MSVLFSIFLGFQNITLLTVEHLSPFWHSFSLYPQHSFLGFPSQLREEGMEKALQHSTFLISTEKNLENT